MKRVSSAVEVARRLGEVGESTFETKRNVMSRSE